MESKTEQELRNEFEGSCSYRLEDGYEYVIRFEYFKAGYKLAQETIKAKDAIITEAREIIKTSLNFNGIKAQIEAEEKAKSWLENNK